MFAICVGMYVICICMHERRKPVTCIEFHGINTYMYVVDICLFLIYTIICIFLSIYVYGLIASMYFYYICMYVFSK